MDLEECATSIRQDLANLAVPRAAVHTGATLFVVGRSAEPQELAKEVGISASRSLASTVLQNAIELGLSHSVVDKSFETRLAMRVASATAASTICRVAISPGGRTMTSAVVVPIIDGVFTGAYFVAAHWDEAGRYIRSRFPREYNFAASAYSFFKGKDSDN